MWGGIAPKYTYQERDRMRGVSSCDTFPSAQISESAFLISREVALQDRYQDTLSSCSQKDIIASPFQCC